MDLKEIKELITFLEGTRFSEVEIESKGVKVRVAEPEPVQQVVAAPVQQAAPPAAPAQAPQAGEATPAAGGGYDVRIPSEPAPGKVIASPIVGTFYRAPAPDKPPYSEVGGVVKKGQVVCIVEAMKLMNEIESEFDGKVAAFLVEDGDPVEFGQPLMRIEA
ncbi:MAG: acetyl-CoA carboxylase biotin carboxyl carrier protein [Leptospirillia bacterium]